MTSISDTERDFVSKLLVGASKIKVANHTWLGASRRVVNQFPSEGGAENRPRLARIV